MSKNKTRYYIEPEDNAALIFKTDAKEKKNIANSAKKKVSHSGCKLPKRGKDELAALNGEVFTYNLCEPWTWEQFTQNGISFETQEAYLTKLATRFGITCTKLDDLFTNIDITTIASYVHSRNLSTSMSKAAANREHRFSEEDAKHWKLFCAGEPTTYGLSETPEEHQKVEEAAEMKTYFVKKAMSEREAASFIGETQSVIHMVLDLTASEGLVHRVYQKFLDKKNRAEKANTVAEEIQDKPVVTPSPNIIADVAKMLREYREAHKDDKGNPLSQRKLGEMIGQAQSIICGAENMKVSERKAAQIMLSLKEIIAETAQPKQAVFASENKTEEPASEPLTKSAEAAASETITELEDEPVCAGYVEELEQGRYIVREASAKSEPYFASAGALTLSGKTSTVVGAIKKIYGPDADDLEVRVFAAGNVHDVLTLRSSIAAVTCAIELIYDGETITLEIAVAA